MIMKRQRKSLAAATVRVFLWCLVFSKNKNRFSGNEETGKKQLDKAGKCDRNKRHSSSSPNIWLSQMGTFNVR